MKRRKQLTFDIDTNVAKDILGGNFLRVYRDIRMFFLRNGFVHIEGSAYMSKNPMEDMEAYYLLDELKKQYPYLDKCVKRIHKADVVGTHSMDKFFHYDGKTDGLEYIYNPIYKKYDSGESQQQGKSR